MSEIKRYTVKIRYITEYLQEMNPYATDEKQAALIAMQMFFDTTRNPETKQAQVIEVKEAAGNG